MYNSMNIVRAGCNATLFSTMGPILDPLLLASFQSKFSLNLTIRQVWGVGKLVHKSLLERGVALDCFGQVLSWFLCCNTLRGVTNWHMNIFAKECSFELFCLGFVLGSGVPFTMCTFIAIPSVTYIQHRSMEWNSF